MASESSGYRSGERSSESYNYQDYLQGGSKYTAPVKEQYTILGEEINKARLTKELSATKSISFSDETPAPVAPQATPQLPPPLQDSSKPTSYKVKVATPEIILFDESTLPVEVLTDLIFENIGGQEILSVSRHNTINGDYISNQLIKNLTSLNQEYSSKKLLSLQNTSDKYFSNFGIKLETKIPFEGNGPDGSNIYIDSSQNIVIELVNLDIDEQIEVQLGIGGTIYTIPLGGV